MPLKLAEVTDQSRIKDAVAERAGVSLRESFDLNLCENPVWKSVDKTKWKNPRGMSYEGQLAPHVSTQRQTLLGGTGLAHNSVTASRGNSWSVVKNEDPNGRNPYSVSHPNVAKELFIRKRNLTKERNISPDAFNKNTRASRRMDDKMTTPTLNRLQGR